MTENVDEFLLNSSTQDILIVPIYQDEIPFNATIGMIDWRLYGLLSSLVKEKTLRGEPYEFLLLPFQHHHGMRNILCVGMGSKKNSSLKDISIKIADKVTRLQIRKVFILDAFLDELPEMEHLKFKKEFIKPFKQETQWIQ